MKKTETYLRSELVREKEIYRKLSRLIELLDSESKTYARLYFLKRSCFRRMIFLRRAIIASKSLPDPDYMQPYVPVFHITNDGKIKEDIL